MNAMATEVYADLEPVARGDDQRGYPLRALVGAIGQCFDQVERLVRAQPGKDAWAQALDPTACPDFLLPWLGQLVGVQVPPHVAPVMQRTQVIAEAGFQRGRPSALISAVQATLTGTRTVRLTERAGDAWTMAVATDPAETPNQALTNLAIAQAKAAGLVTGPGTTTSLPHINDARRTINLATGTINAATLANVI